MPSFIDSYVLVYGMLPIAGLTHWGRQTHIGVGKLIIIGSDNGLSPGRRQAIILTNAWILLIGPLGPNFNEISIEVHTFSFKKMHLKMSSAKGRLFSLGLNELTGSIWQSLEGLFYRPVTGMEVTKDSSANFSTMHNFDFYNSTWLVLGIISLFDKCHRSQVAVTPVKYERYALCVTIFWWFWKLRKFKVTEEIG